MRKYKARLENWNLKFMRFGVRITGQVFDHPQFKDGTTIIAPVVRSCILDSRTVQTTNTVYTLGRSVTEVR